MDNLNPTNGLARKSQKGVEYGIAKISKRCRIWYSKNLKKVRTLPYPFGRFEKFVGGFEKMLFRFIPIFLQKYSKLGTEIRKKLE